MNDVICQIGILLTGLPAIYFINQGKQWASIIGLIGQIFWITTTLRNAQWGMFLLTLFYTYSWGCGVARFLKSLDNPSR